MFNASPTFILYSAANADNLKTTLGIAEYSYFFVRERFRATLQKRHDVIVVSDPEREVDAIYDELADSGRDCIFLSFAPPHKTVLGLRCPTVPVFAWEFDTLPNETWDDDLRNDWRYVLGRLGCAITHSQYSADAIRAAMGEDFPVVSLPAPVWDACREAPSTPASAARCVRLDLHGTIVDSRNLPRAAGQVAPGQHKSLRDRFHVTIRYFVGWYREALRDLLPNTAVRLLSTMARRLQRFLIRGWGFAASAKGMETSDRADGKGVCLDLQGVVYTAVLCPYDGRKNWPDMVTAFCSALADREDATLVLKWVHHSNELAMQMVSRLLTLLPRYKCRVVAVDAFLDADAYHQLMAATTYAVNTSFAEGQCLPLMEFMSCGKPAVTPRHTSMLDYVDEKVAVTVASSPEICCWPHDPRMVFRAHRHRIDWQSLAAAYRDSYEIARHQPERYRQMSIDATERLQGHCSEQVVHERLQQFAELRLCKAVVHRVRDSVLDRGAFVNRLRRADAPRLARDTQNEDVGLRDAKLSGWFRAGTGELLEHFPIDAGDVVLDIGCGEGQFARFAAEQGAAVIIADIDEKKIEAARAKVSGTRARSVRPLVTDANPLPLPDAAVSRVVAMEVLEHVDDPRAFLAELCRVAEPGARFLVSVPAQASEELQERLAPAAYFRRPNHVRIFKGDMLERLVSDAGLVIERKITYGFYWAMWWNFFWACNQELSDPWHPLLRSWEKTWAMLLDTPEGIKTKTVLDTYLPKSQAIIARKPSDHVRSAYECEAPIAARQMFEGQVVSAAALAKT